MSKPKRATNFSKSEEDELVKIVLEKKHIFENKKTDAVTSRQKDAAWEIVAQKFSSSPHNQFRTAKALKDKYNNIKRIIRKKKADDRRELFLTGGGPQPTQDKENVSPVLDELSDVMGLSVDGLPSRNDDDEIVENGYNQTSTEENIEYISGKVIVEDCEMPANGSVIYTMRVDDDTIASPIDWGKYNPPMLLRKKNDVLKTPNPKNREKVAFADTATLKKQILEQQFEHARLEHEQRKEIVRLEHEQKIMQSAEEFLR